ncbi:MAG: XrtA/PEP-CTERM system histidine kinase PrsK [Woeseiaceae bacterium]
MDYQEISVFGFVLAGLLFLVMAVLLWTRWRDHSKSQILALPVFFSALWAFVLAATSDAIVVSTIPSVIAELLRCFLWATSLVVLLRALVVDEETDAVAAHSWMLILLGVSILGTLLLTFSVLPITSTIQTCIYLIASVFVMFMAEQIYRHTPQESGTGLRYFCMSVAAIFAYDAIYWVRELIAEGQNERLSAARGYVNSLLSLPIFYSIKERFNISLDNLLPRQIVFYSFSLISLTFLIVAIIAGDFFIRQIGGAWSDVLRIVFAVVLLMLLATMVVSRSYRNKARVLMMKALFQYKYDYRREWLRFIATLSQSQPDQPVPVTAIRAISQIVNSPGGIVWAQHEGDEYVPLGALNTDLPVDQTFDNESGLIHFLKERQWVIDLDEMSRYPSRYESRGQEELSSLDDDWWLIIPMMLGDRLSGFIMLLRPSEVPVLNFEDHDLLKTAGRHVATHIEQADADRRLAEVSQFGAYNRLTAFLMHDLNNLIAQQSLVVDNAERFRENQDFVDDAIETIAHSVDRMRRLMEQLSTATKQPELKKVRLDKVVTEAVSRAKGRSPVPTLVGAKAEILVQADRERLTMVLGHLLRNAQEATSEDGTVSVAVKSDSNMVEVLISDSGVGMSPDFIRSRLFRPFDSTKGSQGMGIGVYQAREYVRSLGGIFSVSSSLGEGTSFRLELPIVS